MAEALIVRKGGLNQKRTYLYKDGVINTNIAGGISTNYTLNGSVTYNSNHILMTGTYIGGTTFGRASISSVNSLNFQEYKTLCVEYEITQETADIATPAITLSAQTSRTFADSYLAVSQHKETISVSSNLFKLSLPLENWNISKYPSFYIDPEVSSGSVTLSLKVYKIWLE